MGWDVVGVCLFVSFGPAIVIFTLKISKSSISVVVAIAGLANSWSRKFFDSSVFSSLVSLTLSALVWTIAFLFSSLLWWLLSFILTPPPSFLLLPVTILLVDSLRIFMVSHYMWESFESLLLQVICRLTIMSSFQEILRNFPPITFSTHSFYFRSFVWFGNGDYASSHYDARDHRQCSWPWSRISLAFLPGVLPLISFRQDFCYHTEKLSLPFILTRFSLLSWYFLISPSLFFLVP